MGARALSLAAVVTLASCAVGPDYKRPPVPAAASYIPGGTPARTVTAQKASQEFVTGMDIPAEWWALFRSPALDSMVKQALINNPNIEAAQAALRQAHEQVLAQRGAYWPQVSASASPSRNKTAFAAYAPIASTTNPYYSLYTGQVSVSFTPDVFGLNRRTVESLQAQAENQRFQLEATYLTLTSNVVAAAIQEASLIGQAAATQDTIDIERKLLGVMRRQFALGQIARVDLLAQEAALAQAEQGLPPLAKQLDQQRDLLAALMGRSPGEKPYAAFDLASFTLPRKVPVSVPSQLVLQRPDVQAAAESLHSASAQIGVAIANRLPQFLLTADIGTAALKAAELFGPGSGFWTLSAEVTQPIFQGGTLLHKQRAAVAAFDQAKAQYRATVIGAFQNVADSLHALRHDAEAVQAADEAVVAAERSLTVARKQLELGATSYLNVLNAENTYQQARLTLVQAQANRLADTAALFQALGGGWWNRNRQPTEAARDATTQVATRSEVR